MKTYSLRQLCKRIDRKINYILDNIYIKTEKKLLYYKVKQNRWKKCIYLFSNPIHPNLGDQAQTYCILNWFNEYFPDYKIICAPQKITTEKTLNLILEKLSEEDLIFIHSGYLIFDPHPELPFICDIVNFFKNKKIVILPQTVNLSSNDVISKITSAFNNHSNITLLCRDDVSYANARALFPKCKLILWPDFVTSLIGIKTYNNKRNGILFCLRNDGEKLYSDSELNILKGKFDNVNIITSDTTISRSAYAWKFIRKKLVKNVLNDFSKYNLIITDRYHGTIFSQITSTPVIVLSSSDHKLSSGVKWFPENIFGANVFFAENLLTAYEIALVILKRNGKIINNPAYFVSEYFSALKTQIEK
jgi:exopolysaccharide biosynthesis predicted pyruvyltransferase EpsI